MLELIKISQEYRDQVVDMLEEWENDIQLNNGNRSPRAIFSSDYHDFNAYLENLDHSKPTEGRVPNSVYFLYDDKADRMIGAADIRHYLNEGMYQTGGHIGDGIRPSERKKGYGTKLIALALEKCKEMGIERVLMTCSKSNIGSAKCIMNNGGVLENEVDEDGEICQRYWIDLRKKGEKPKEFYTERLHLRPITMEDVPDIYRNWTSNPQVCKYLTWSAHPDEELTKKIVSGWVEAYQDEKTFRYGIELCDHHELIGMIDIVKWVEGAPEIGYVLSQNYWRQGYMSEAFAKTCEILKEMGYKKMVMCAQTENGASNRVIQKTGFVFTHQATMELPLKNNIEVLLNWYEKEL